MFRVLSLILSRLLVPSLICAGLAYLGWTAALVLCVSLWSLGAGFSLGRCYPHRS